MGPHPHLLLLRAGMDRHPHRHDNLHPRGDRDIPKAQPTSRHLLGARRNPHIHDLALPWRGILLPQPAALHRPKDDGSRSQHFVMGR